MSPSSIALTCDRNFVSWLENEALSLALTTYNSNRLLLLGRKPGNRLGVFERQFDRPMGLFVEDDQAFWLSTRYQLWRFVNALRPGQWLEDGDRLYVPRQSWVTGDLDIHDLVIDAGSRPVFVATTLNALATVSATHSARVLWKPRFITATVGEDRCHLNGLGLRDGIARYVTVVGRSDVVDGWREHRAGGGMVIDVTTDEVIATGLSMPHSPRWYRDRIWLLNSGTGEFGFIDEAAGRFEPITFCPGYARGLAFHGRYAVIGLSKPRDASFTGLALDDRLEAKGTAARCGLLVVDIESGQSIHWVRFEGAIAELYDVQILRGPVRPRALGFRSDTIASFIVLDSP